MRALRKTIAHWLLMQAAAIVDDVQEHTVRDPGEAQELCSHATGSDCGNVRVPRATGVPNLVLGPRAEGKNDGRDRGVRSAVA